MISVIFDLWMLPVSLCDLPVCVLNATCVYSAVSFLRETVGQMCLTSCSTSMGGVTYIGLYVRGTSSSHLLQRPDWQCDTHCRILEVVSLKVNCQTAVHIHSGSIQLSWKVLTPLCQTRLLSQLTVSQYAFHINQLPVRGFESALSSLESWVLESEPGVLMLVCIVLFGHMVCGGGIDIKLCCCFWWI